MGLILPQEVETTWCVRTADHLRNVGYPEVPYRSKVKISVLDLPSESNITVYARCDFCGEEFTTPYKRIAAARKTNTGLNCPKCKAKRMSAVKVMALPPSLPYQEESWLRQEYLDNNRTVKSIADEFGISHQTVEKFLKRYGIRKMLCDVHMPTKDELVQLYVVDGHGANYIASLFPGVGVETIFRLLDEYDIPRYAPGELMSLWWSKDSNRTEMSKIRLALWEDDEYRAKTSEHLHDVDAVAKRAKERSMRYQGQTEENWTGFLTPQARRERNSEKFQQWRRRVFERDDYRCQCCGRRSAKGCPVVLNAHHIENFARNDDLRYDVNNGVTLCRECHDPRIPGSFHNLYGTINNDGKQFVEYMKARGVSWPLESGVNDEPSKSKIEVL